MDENKKVVTKRKIMAVYSDGTSSSLHTVDEYMPLPPSADQKRPIR